MVALDTRNRWPTAMPGCPECGHNDSGLYTDYHDSQSRCICWWCESVFSTEDGIEGVTLN